MNYDEARDLIKDGDLVAERETHGFLTPFTRFFTRSPVTHTGVAYWNSDGLWMAELNGGKNHGIPLAQLAATDFDVYNCPVGDRAAVRAAIMANLQTKIEYGFIALLVIGLLNWLRFRVFLHARQVLVCSGFCVKIYEEAGWPERSRIISPQDLVTQLERKFEYRPTPSKPASAGFSL